MFGTRELAHSYSQTTFGSKYETIIEKETHELTPIQKSQKQNKM